MAATKRSSSGVKYSAKPGEIGREPFRHKHPLQPRGKYGIPIRLKEKYLR
jgi:hypothetical protein